MKSEVRKVKVRGEVAAAVDAGADVDAQMKALSAKDKECKARISAEAAGLIQAGESSVKLVGDKASAMASAVEKVAIDASKPEYPALVEAVKGGYLPWVKREAEVVVALSDVEKAVAILKAAGMVVSVKETLTVEPDALRSIKAGTFDGAGQAAQKALAACANVERSFRVKYG